MLGWHFDNFQTPAARQIAKRFETDWEKFALANLLHEGFKSQSDPKPTGSSSLAKYSVRASNRKAI